ncbi:DUF742 domain-containing protein [Streptomyces sp. NPDC052236]|uniref:DUF742 domain-containing protein n=1 Tax=Streptomyces sp. NPDC052236 TaxID=3365686 RepID=UPI0037CF20BF
MATPPGGRPYDGYDSAHQTPGEHSQNRFNFPSTPTGQGGQQPYQQPQTAQSPYNPNAPYNPNSQNNQYGGYGQPQQPRIQPAAARRARQQAAPAAHNPLVRPYAMTGGRTRPRYQLAIEALVSTTADPSRLQGQLPEHQRICRLCFEIKSVAEISALLSIPLGVARILVADLAEAGLVAIHQPAGDEAGGTPDVTLLERVLSGLRKL